MQLDTFLEIGTKGKMCQDYIISGEDPIPYIILSDGCSTANNSEVGARILCHLAKQYLKYNKDNLLSLDYWKLGQCVIYNSEQIIRQLGLSRSSLIATLVVACIINDNIEVMIYGDGSLITIFPNGKTEIISVDFPENTPFYLSYLIDDKRFKEYQRSYSTKKIKYITDNSEPTTSTVTYDYPTVFSNKISDISLTLVTSDGIDSFLKPDSSGSKIICEAKEIITPCIAFKNTKGKFLQRRMNKQMEMNLKNGITHYDDLSVGAFLNIGGDI